MVVGAVVKVAVAGFDGVLSLLENITSLARFSGYRETCICALQSVLYLATSFPSFEPLLLLYCIDNVCESS